MQLNVKNKVSLLMVGMLVILNSGMLKVKNFVIFWKRNEIERERERESMIERENDRDILEREGMIERD